ncbi:Methyltransferase [Geosmithia morbida]|uniref:Methyltransferase n=1 Tax=Geosmithia morbida TaxID=1094350 RepID=A0A9P4YY12_9HYPO|nr:Methyltransferase [Geosmithia morbida]KAF4123879.1 Methyltransferase [Geosmithia morbida]
MSTTTTPTTESQPVTLPPPSRVPRGDVTVNLNFYEPPADPSSVPFIFVDPLPSDPGRNFTDLVVPTRLHDIRGRESSYNNLDRDAFAVVRGVPPSAEDRFRDDASIKANYYPEVERLLLDSIPGSERVYIFDHTIRRDDPSSDRHPVQSVHIDQTAASAAKRVRRYFGADGDEAERLLAGRYRIVNVWRPLGDGPVESHPLAFASSETVDDADVVPVEHRYRSGYVGQTAAIRHNPAQRWYYLSGMTGDERLLLECFDSDALRPGSAVAGGRVPHSAFEDPRTAPDAKPRESIEVRALVFGP